MSDKAEFIPEIEKLDDTVEHFAKGSTGSLAGTGGMATKISAARIASASGCDMVIANADDLGNIHRIVHGAEVGTYIHSDKRSDFFIEDFVNGE